MRLPDFSDFASLKSRQRRTYLYKASAPLSITQNCCRLVSIFIMSPLHINMTNVFHTGRPRGSISSATSVSNTARPLPSSRSLTDFAKKLKRILSKYAGFVGPGILISIAYMVAPLRLIDVRTPVITPPMSLQARNSNTNSSVSFLCPTSLPVSCKP
jgi:hypothetical protein